MATRQGRQRVSFLQAASIGRSLRFGVVLDMDAVAEHAFPGWSVTAMCV